MEVELSLKIDKNGTPIEFKYKTEDGADKDFCEVLKFQLKKLCGKADRYIDANCATE